MEFFKNDDVGKLIVRLMVSVLILFHGVHKVLNPGSIGFIENMLAGAGLPGFIAYGVYLGEVVGPIMILLGVLSRIGGVLVVINMLFAIGLVRLGAFVTLTSNGAWAIQLDLFFLLSALAVVFLGSGRYALLPEERLTALRQRSAERG